MPLLASARWFLGEPTGRIILTGLLTVAAAGCSVGSGLDIGIRSADHLLSSFLTKITMEPVGSILSQASS